MTDVNEQGQPSQDTPWMRIQEQLRFLDRSLSTIDGKFHESIMTRTYICAQIEALKWAARLLEVE